MKLIGPAAHGTAGGLQGHRLDQKPVCAMCLTYACDLERIAAQAALTNYRRQTNRWWPDDLKDTA